MFCMNCGASLAAGARFCASCGQVVAAAAPVAPQPVVSPAVASAFTSQPFADGAGSLASTKYAGFWQRAAAAVIDGVLIWIGLIVLVGALDEVGFLLGMFGCWLYYALQESSAYQATLGKRALGIIVTDQFGAPLTFGRATGRFFTKYLSSMFFGIGYLIAAFTARKQALHDLIASTIVIRQ